MEKALGRSYGARCDRRTSLPELDPKTPPKHGGVVSVSDGRLPNIYGEDR